ncbi:MAG: hypothetical protein H8E26_14140 [FCB group bacterium]|nr:hypothetical protein [FCB group bacterium]MBL7027424.1 hypothetical protein [Candidatus Neomarinimicrobiota bacterium]MBL7122594.1 hypothetical protein [Candidatus Neomarinimicrobiota bacterium]
MKRLSLNLAFILFLICIMVTATLAMPEPVAREITTDFIIEPVEITPEFDFWSMFEGADWFEKILLYLPFFTAVLFVLDKVVKWTPNKYDDVIVAFFKSIIAAISGYNSRKKKSRG